MSELPTPIESIQPDTEMEENDRAKQSCTNQTQWDVEMNKK